jgi:transposase
LIFTPDPRVGCRWCSNSDWKGTAVEIVYERVAAIDVGKKEVAVTVRVPGQAQGARAQQTRKFRTFYPVLRQMVSWLVEQGVTQVAMEATGVFWKPVFHALGEADTMEVVLVNARHVKNVPGRKTDVKDSRDRRRHLRAGHHRPKLRSLLDRQLHRPSQPQDQLTECNAIRITRH